MCLRKFGLINDDERLVSMSEQTTRTNIISPFFDMTNEELEPIKIKLKDCCLTCPDFDPTGMMGFGMLATSHREIACGHMAVCYKYLGKDDVRE